MTAARLDRSSWPAPLRPARIVHIGVGNFSRAHQAWYTAADPTRAWGILGFTGRRRDLADALAPQQGLYTLIERGPLTDRMSVIDAVCEVRPGADVDGLVEALAAPQTSIVTLTVTEAGYGPSPVLGSGLPSAPGRLALGLAQRRQRGAGPLAVVSCDNLHANGSVLRGRTLALADQLGAGLGAWVEREVSFVSTSVDRITPATTDGDRRLAEAEIGLVDAAPVVTEPFSDWVLCGEFPGGRPDWEVAGARFVADIEPWEQRKLWLLNGGHSLLAYLGLLRGHQTVADAIADVDLADVLERFWDLAQRHLPAGDLDLAAYRRQLLERFANARISYPLTQIAGDGLGKLRNRVLPVIEAALAAGESAEPALLVVAAWSRWLIDGPERAATDQNAELLRAALSHSGSEDQAAALADLLAPGGRIAPTPLHTTTNEESK
jgi:fructuronate reductase